jgi:hypothetical protein
MCKAVCVMQRFLQLIFICVLISTVHPSSHIFYDSSDVVNLKLILSFPDLVSLLMH